MTLVPKDAIKKLGIELKPENKYEFIGSDGSRDLYEIAQLELIFCHRNFKGQFLMIEQTYGIIGRNILNAVPILLNGPKLAWEIHTAK